jgi:hypothetical protein
MWGEPMGNAKWQSSNDKCQMAKAKVEVKVEAEAI